MSESLTKNKRASYKPRRSALYMPAINTRAMNKAQTLEADVVILDLEDAVAPEQKTTARELLQTQLSSADYGLRELVVRVNGVDSPWYEQDIAMLKQLAETQSGAAERDSVLDAVALPKTESQEQVAQLRRALNAAGLSQASIWPMIETPTGVFNARAICADAQGVDCLVMGTSDLAKDLQLPAANFAGGDSGGTVREGLLHALSHCVLAAREARIDILDGVCLDLDGEAALDAETQQGKQLGFTGKTLIHPKQLAVANRIFGVDSAEHERAKTIMAAWREAEQAGSGLTVVDGKLVESLHVEAAERVCALAEAIERRGF